MTTKSKMIWTLAIVALGTAAAIGVKVLFFPSVSDKYFQTNPAQLRRVPEGYVVVRPTHFAGKSSRGARRENQVAYVNVKGAQRMVGANVTLQTLIAIAYQHTPGRIALPPGDAKAHYDFLVTVPKDPSGRLKSAIRRKLGYTAALETRDTDVMALTVENPSASGLQLSSAGERENANVKNGRLYFTHMRLSVISDGLEGILKMPVIDKTGLTNFYDFSLTWDARTAQQIQSGSMDEETGKKILGEWGLGLRPDTAPIEMLVVRKT